MEICSPIAGIAIPLSDVPDPVFAGEIMGPGIAVNPVQFTTIPVLAPVSGVITKIHPHAFIVHADGGADVLVHLGVDTVTLKGRGFHLRHGEGARVNVGDIVVDWDISVATEAGLMAFVPVIVLNGTGIPEPLIWPSTPVTAGSPLLRL